MSNLGWAFSVGFLCVGCVGAGAGGGGELGKPVSQFPSRSELDSVAGSAPPTVKETTPGLVDADAWQTEAPAAPAVAYPEETAWDKLLVEAVRQHSSQVALSPELRCAARETARFYTVHGGMPDDGVREHLLLRCGSSLSTHTFSYLSNSIPDSVPAAQLEASARPTLLKHLDDRLKGATGQIALGVVRANGRFAAVVMSGTPRVALRAFSPVVRGSSVTLEGELKGGAQYLAGLVNQGQFGVAYCEGDPRVALPAFRVTCPFAAEDQSARIELAVKQPARVLFEPVASIEVRREGSNPEYKAGAYGANQTVASSAQFRTALLADLNKVRAAANLSPFALEAQQSVTDERMAPYLYQASRDGDDQRLSTISLGLLAGWDVRGGLIRNGGVFLRSINTARNPSRWLTQALDSPLGRWVLLEPGMSRIGIGSTELNPSGEMALVTTYALFDQPDHKAEEVAVLLELNRLRKAQGAAPLQRVVGDAALTQALAQVAANKLNTSTAMDNVLQQAAETTGSSVRGYVVETNDIKLMKWDPLLIESSTLDVEVGVTHYRAPGAAWGQYVVLFVVLNHGNPVREAKRGGTSHRL